MKPRVLLITREPIGRNMNAMGIRYFEFARWLSGHYDVTLIAPKNDSSFTYDGFSFFDYSTRNLIRAIRRSDVIIVTNPHPLVIIAKTLFKKAVILDLYDPLIIDKLEKLAVLPYPRRKIAYFVFWDWLKAQIRHSDYYLCSNERQKDFYLGLLGAFRKLNPDTYSRDANGKGLISIVATGVSDVPPVKTKKVLREVIPGLKASDKILLWVGAPNKWFDEKLLIKAMKELSGARQDIKLVFMCGDAGKSELLRENIRFCDSLGLTGKNVFFLDRWVPFEELADYYFEADVGLSLHHCHLETRYSMRNRILGYLWARLPVIVTEGDTMADLVSQNGLGIVIKENHKENLISAILTMVDNSEFYGKCARAVEESIGRFYWNEILDQLQYAVDTAHHIGVKGRIRALPGVLMSLLSLGCRFVNCRLKCGSMRVWTGRNCSSLS